ncbi:MAG: 50S ribosomal protein L28 [Candidatus Aminicenantes bacterium ADurb.Bin508]|nr:MAG: 50S ribosomal protein L28 [Candidatus Aminicenantes bacterium ADurb.Bin508]HNX41944.1 50S ribosomal protein L28 [Candidatus Aminicenantes bacterium]HPB55703.1 50S ribosomal protein L28 [Candidatus Aminicenantes bacterium]HPT00175.1 50S ribosomal protein L28 [Candidatus Aminicenantes bacterium]
MSKFCQVCGKRPSTGNIISHSHRATKRRWVPNLQRIKLRAGDESLRVWVCTKCLRQDRWEKAVSFPTQP